MDTPSLFEDAASAPLAHRVRPRGLEDYVGQEHVLGPARPLRQAIERDQVPSLILWGPPGTGKTTLAGLIAARTKARFVPFSAVTGGLPELRTHLKQASEDRRRGLRTVLFIDEVHRFNKGQQDAFLPHVEDGTITLIGATTENPSFELNAALLSRAQVVPLRALTEDEVTEVLRRAIAHPQGLGAAPEAYAAVLPAIVAYAGGDARLALNALEAVAALGPPDRLTPEAVGEVLLSRPTGYDKTGEQHYDVVSAFIKSIRGSDPDAALLWLARMLEGGEDARFIARRLVILASEDVGNADPHALMLAVAAMQAVGFVGLPEGALTLAQATTYLATCPKSNASYVAIKEARRTVRELGTPQVPLHLRNAPTRLMEHLGHGEGYRYPHDHPGGHVAQSYWPEGLAPRTFYRPVARGFEDTIRKRLDVWRQALDRPAEDR